MKKSLLTILILIASFATALSQKNAAVKSGIKEFTNPAAALTYPGHLTVSASNVARIAHLEIPRTRTTDIITLHAGYSLLYNEAHEQASWVAYELTGAETRKIAARTNRFLPDPLVKTISANNRDYAGSGYDRGHLAPAGDMGWSSTAMAESFYYSNMSPQVPSFNRGIWKRLEEQVRTWAVENNSVYVATGPVLTNSLQSIGPDHVSVPEYFYKVILDYTLPEIKGIGFILPNESSASLLQNYAVTIDSVEKITGIDFFSAIPDSQERQIENSLCIRCWSWSNKSTADKKTVAGKKASTAVRCKAITKAGTRCKKRTLNASGYCNQHSRQ